MLATRGADNAATAAAAAPSTAARPSTVWQGTRSPARRAGKCTVAMAGSDVTLDVARG